MPITNPKDPVGESRDSGMVAPGSAIGESGSVVIHGEALVLRAVNELKPNQKNVRTHSKRQIRELAATIKSVGFIGAVIVDATGKILAGHARHAAAKLLGMPLVPTICVNRLSDAQMRAFVLADNKFAERSGWDRQALAAELEELSLLLPDLNLDLSLTGFEAGEIDILLGDLGEAKGDAEDQLPPPTAGPAVTRPGDLWRLGEHLLLCGDARSQPDYQGLMAGEQAAVVFTDPPYNVCVKGHVQGRGRVRHNEFAFASGEMSDQEFRRFLSQSLSAAAAVSRTGALHFVCMDWRHIEALIGVGRDIYSELLNLIVWNKTNAGQGSFYRSQHELIGLFRVGDGPHQNNIELGKHGRNRTNVWTYAGVNSFGAGRDALLAAHPTVKPVALVADALKDCTSKGDLALDPFLGSGTTILAAEKVGRRARGIEFEPAYVDVAIRRWQAYTKSDALLEADGRTFEEVAAERLNALSNTPPALPTGDPALRQEVNLELDWVALCTGQKA